MRKTLALLLALVLVFSLAACGSKEVPENTSTEPEVAEEVVPEVEDSLVVYTTAAEDVWEAFVTPYREKYPDVEIEVTYGGIGDLMARVKGEASAPVADIVVSGLSSTDGDKYNEFFEDYVSSSDPELIVHSKNGKYSQLTNSVVCLCVNKELEAELGLNITSYADLLDEKLAGKIIFSDPNSSSAAWNNVMNMNCVFGINSDEFWAYVEQLMPNLVISDSSSACFNSVVDGEYVVGITYEGGVATVLNNGADWVELRYFDDGVSGLDGSVAVIKNCKHPLAAKAMVEMLTSEEGQNAIYAVYPSTRLSNTKASIPAGVDSPLKANSELNWVERDTDTLGSLKEEILAKWNDIYSQCH